MKSKPPLTAALTSQQPTTTPPDPPRPIDNQQSWLGMYIEALAIVEAAMLTKLLVDRKFTPDLEIAKLDKDETDARDTTR